MVPRTMAHGPDHPAAHDAAAAGGGVGRVSSAGGIGLAVYAAAALSLAAALVHLWVAPEHLGQWWGYGAFFIAAALCQGLGGVLILRWPERQALPLVGIWGNLALVALYVVTRTRGVPYGPHVLHTEDPELLGMSATAAELVLVMLLVGLLRGRPRELTMTALLVAGASLWALRALGVLP